MRQCERTQAQRPRERDARSRLREIAGQMGADPEQRPEQQRPAPAPADRGETDDGDREQRMCVRPVGSARDPVDAEEPGHVVDVDEHGGDEQPDRKPAIDDPTQHCEHEGSREEMGQLVNRSLAEPALPGVQQHLISDEQYERNREDARQRMSAPLATMRFDASSPP